MTTADAQSSEKAELFSKVGAGTGGRRIEFFDRHITPRSPVVDGEQYCEYPPNIPDAVDLHAFHEGTCDVQTLYADTESDGPSLGSYTFPPNFTFPRHWHDSDQIVFVLEGTMRMGNRVFYPGSGTFTRSETAYSFTAGPAGVTFLEFRPKSNFRTVIVEDDPDKYVRTDLIT
jgi:hypothetical protein